MTHPPLELPIFPYHSTDRRTSILRRSTQLSDAARSTLGEPRGRAESLRIGAAKNNEYRVLTPDDRYRYEKEVSISVAQVGIPRPKKQRIDIRGTANWARPNDDFNDRIGAVRKSAPLMFNARRALDGVASRLMRAERSMV
jgi:hypothetical protein